MSKKNASPSKEGAFQKTPLTVSLTTLHQQITKIRTSCLGNDELERIDQERKLLPPNI